MAMYHVLITICIYYDKGVRNGGAWPPQSFDWRGLAPPKVKRDFVRKPCSRILTYAANAVLDLSGDLRCGRTRDYSEKPSSMVTIR